MNALHAFVAIWCATLMLATAPTAGEDRSPDGIVTDQLVGTELRNPDGEHLGTITDVVADPEDDEPALVIVAHGGVLGIGEREVAVPWRLLRQAPDGRSILLNASPEAMAAAPEPDVDLLAIPEMFVEHRNVVDDYWAAEEQ